MNAPSATLGEGLIERLRDQRISGFNAAMRVREEAADWITKLERENLELRHDMERGMTNHNADLSATLDPSRVPGCKGNPDTCMRPMCSVATPRCAVPSEKKASAWVPVTERLPKNLEAVLVEGGIAVWRDPCPEWPEGKFYTITAIEYPGKPIQWDVTHWMPFPDGPALEANRQGGA